MDTKVSEIVSDRLCDLRDLFVANGFELWLVGGACRDTLMGKTPKDIDLATSATPDEQMMVYRKNKIRFIPTGLQHGTITAVLDQPYEITGLRTESEHDGRYAVMTFTRDLTEDLSRRDLTINAIAMDFDGNVIDPFGGRDDIVNNRVRFVGDAEERMREDYLRILRFFRFHARIAGSAPLCDDASKAIEAARTGLRDISAERVWSEMQRIISGPAAGPTLAAMQDLSVLDTIGMPKGSFEAMETARIEGVTDPASLMGVYVTDGVDGVADAWKWSNEERERARFINRFRSETDPEVAMKQALTEGKPIDWARDVMLVAGKDPTALMAWQVPKMPVGGRDLIEAGISPGPQMGKIIDALRKRWVESDYTLDRDQLMTGIF